MTAVPRDFEERKLLFNDRVGNEFDGSAKAHQLVDSLKAHVIKYNSLAGEEKKIPLVRTVLNLLSACTTTIENAVKRTNEDIIRQLPAVLMTDIASANDSLPNTRG